ncbi:hypothetical protein IJJ36_04050 [Candidatus Saccharibacteria bacterium]|nr:hypothetical protein [Candidatus Saccharibacteria bacterium]MBQ6461567.1 hypothetical protein [Candidatus Saccharibacteria bacterium]
MIVDTVKIRIDNPHIPPTAYDKFEPSAKDLFEYPYATAHKHASRKLNPTKEDIHKGIYLPRATLHKAVRPNGYVVYLEIEFSAPKIIFNNNFDELTDSDFERLCQTLSEKMTYMGLPIGADEIANARVQTIHYGKNILTGYTLARSVIADISKADITKVKDFEEKAYKNGGESLYFHTLKHGVVIYDKKAELERSKRQKKGLIENDYYCQTSLFENKAPPNPFEVVRIEARYIGKPQIRNLATKLGLDLPDDFRFADLFSSSIAQKALLYELEEIKRGNFAFADSNATSLAEFIQQIRFQNPTITPRAFSNAVLDFVLSQQYNSREIRNFLGYDSARWSSLKSSVKNLKYERRVANGFDILEQGLNDFTPVKITI